ncbi:hypothetical protein GOODEAATRI_034232 [Goodea atripinnis]|uniref:Uncharacterized protein n=1 Tax=Goodea atripinnis TaxID=208336 RepID=A0ABV0PA01_9TELE
MFVSEQPNRASGKGALVQPRKVQSALTKREREKQIKHMIKRLKFLEGKHMDRSKTNTLNQIEETKQELNNIYGKQMEKNAKFTKQSYYENIPKYKNFLENLKTTGG